MVCRPGRRIGNHVVRLPPASTAASVRRVTRRSHHVDHAGREAEQKEHDETERGRRQQTVETPADRRADKNTGDQLRRKPKTARHGRSRGYLVFARPFGLVSPGFSAATKFGQPLIETSEPCGKRSIVRRFIATSLPILVRAFRHVVETRYDRLETEITPHRPQKPRGPY